MSAALFIIGKRVVNIDQVMDAKWEGDSLYLHFLGNGFVTFRGSEASLIWAAIEKLSVNLNTGEVKA
jgi:hypothetical protein